MLPTGQTTQNCAKRMLDINATSFNPYVSQIEDTFEENPAYQQVYRNLDFTTTYKTWIEEGNAPDKILPYKKMASYPYSTPQFEIGDFVSFPYGNIPMSHWFLESLDSQVYYNVIGRLIPLNQQINHRTAVGNIVNTYVSFQDKFNYTNYKYGAKGITIPSGMARLLTQQNDVTALWHKNTRLIVGETVFKVQQIMRQLNSRYVEFYLTEDAEAPGDDFVNKIAWNAPNENAELNGIVIAPKVFEILEGAAQEYSVFSYLNGVQTTNTFAITASGVDGYYYRLTASGNSFTVQNMHFNNNSMLTVTVVDNSTSSTDSIQIRLASEY